LKLTPLDSEITKNFMKTIISFIYVRNVYMTNKKTMTGIYIEVYSKKLISMFSFVL